MRSTVLISLFAAGLVLAATMSSEASGQATVSGGNWSFPAGSTSNQVEIKVTGLPAEGLGASDVRIAFDSSVLEVTTACTTGDMAGACNPHAPAGPARAAGFAIFPITSEPVVIARATFDCVGTPGSFTALTLTIVDDELIDGSLAPIPYSVQHGNVVCFAPATPTPTQAPTPAPTPAPTTTPAGTPGPTPAPSVTQGPPPAPTSTPSPSSTPQKTATAPPDPGKPALGDVDCSGEVNSVDALKLLLFDAGLSVSQAEGCPEIGA